VPDLRIPTAAGELPAYLSHPPVGSGPWPGVVVIHDAFGLTDIAREHADHLAAAGYLAVAPDLYSQGGFARCVRSTMRSLMQGEGRPFDEIDAVRRWLEDQSESTGRTGIIGFCMGGGFALATAASGFAASAPNYGALPKDLSVLDGACPIVGSYGAKDRALGGAAAALESALSERNVVHDVKEYPDAGHSFLDRINAGPLLPLLRVAGFGYHQASAQDAWTRILRFFDEHLGEPSP
jgi:carboxymethylenebutenolidase